MSSQRVTANTSLYNNRKIKPAMTGYGTIREIDSGEYVIILHFEGWKKAHAVDVRNPIPFESIKYYDTFKLAQLDCKKYLLNVLLRPRLKASLSRYDSLKIAVHESPVKY